MADLGGVAHRGGRSLAHPLRGNKTRGARCGTSVKMSPHNASVKMSPHGPRTHGQPGRSAAGPGSSRTTGKDHQSRGCGELGEEHAAVQATAGTGAGTRAA